MIFTALISALLMTIFISAGEDISIMFYADERAGNMLVITSMIILPLVINQLSASLLNTLGREKKTFISSIISSIGLILTLLILAKAIGIYAYPAALLVYHSIGLIFNTINLKKYTDISLSYLVVCGLTLAISIGVGYLVKLIGLSYQQLNIFGRVCISSIISTLIFGVFALPIVIKLKKHRNAIISKNSNK